MTIDFSQVISAEDKAATARAAERDRIKARRNAALASGTRVAGIAVHTDDLSQQRIVGAALAASLDPATTVNWKAADGAFVTLDAAQIVAIAKAVREHVQACFNREADILASLAAGETYDIEEGWPG